MEGDTADVPLAAVRLGGFAGWLSSAWTTSDCSTILFIRSMDFTTYGTAKRLFEAGFPQPEKERGQVWFRNREHEVPKYQAIALPMIVIWRAAKRTRFYAGYAAVLESHWDKEECPLVFAPTAQDIIPFFSRFFHWSESVLTFDSKSKLWICRVYSHDGKGATNDFESKSNSCAEACADAYLLCVSFVS